MKWTISIAIVGGVASFIIVPTILFIKKEGVEKIIQRVILRKQFNTYFRKYKQPKIKNYLPEEILETLPLPESASF